MAEASYRKLMPRSSLFQIMATVCSFGDISFSSDRRFVVSVDATSEMPVINGDPPAKVLKLYGPPPHMFAAYRLDPLRGTFTNGKLIDWQTTPPPPPVP